MLTPGIQGVTTAFILALFSEDYSPTYSNMLWGGHFNIWRFYKNTKNRHDFSSWL